MAQFQASAVTPAFDIFVVYKGTPRIGPINAKTTRADLDKHFGKENLKDSTQTVGEDGMEMATTEITKKDFAADIYWDSPKQKKIWRVTIHKKNTLWRTEDNLKVGMTAKALEKFNGKPFKFSGLGWDFGGQIESDQGPVSNLSPLTLTLGSENETAKETEKFFGDAVTPSSNDKNIEKAGIVVIAMTLYFNK